MEFFAEIKNQNIGIEALAERLTIANLPAHCASISTVLSNQGDSGEIYCIWGQFAVSRERIKNGVRFALLNCPHAFVWTTACHNDGRDVVIHCTIDKQHEDPDFVESIQQFVADWESGLKNALASDLAYPA